VVDWPLAYHAWAAGEHLLKAVVAAAGPSAEAALSKNAPRDNPLDSHSQLRVVNPPDGAVYLIDPTLRREFQTISLRGTTEARARIEWHIDGEPLGTIDSDASLDWPLSPGRHVISAHDARGQRASAEIVVK
jgi:penicillin-binding protein 1C